MTPNIEAVCFTDSTTSCLKALRRATGMREGPIERHSARVFFIMERLAQQASLEIDREVAACAALLHDIGIYEPITRPRFYLRHGRVLAGRLLEPFEWSAERRRRCLDAIELHHRLRPQWSRGQEVELLRLADLVDASRGVVTFGLERNWMRSLFESIPRAGMQRELLRYSVRGAPCMTRGILRSVLNVSRRSTPDAPRLT